MQEMKINRISIPKLDNLLGLPVKVLDHGFIRCIDYMGDDSSIVQGARVSYGKGTKTPSDDQGLINYLMRHNHTSPFELNELKIHVKLPVFVARQWVRHRTASLNEYSARYSILKDEFYIPEPSRIAVQSSNNKQGSGETLSPEKAEEVRRILMEDAATAYDNYEGLSDPEGEYKLARELARINLPVNVYTEWYWKTDLHNLMHFLKLRADSHAQYEIRVYAEALCDLLRIWCPMTYNAFMRYKINAKSFSGIEMNVLKELLSSIPLDDAVKSKLRTSFIEQGASSGEIKEFFQKLS